MYVKVHFNQENNNYLYIFILQTGSEIHVGLKIPVYGIGTKNYLPSNWYLCNVV